MTESPPLKAIKNDLGYTLILHPNGDTTVMGPGDQIGVGVAVLPTWFPGTNAAVLHDHSYETFAGAPQELRFMVDRNLWLNWIAEINHSPWYMTLWMLPMSFAGRFLVKVLGGRVSSWKKKKQMEFDKPKYGLKDSDIKDIPETFELVAVSPNSVQQSPQQEEHHPVLQA